MRCAVVFGQFGVAADPVNLPHFRDRLAQAGIETILVEHTDSQKVFDFKPDAIVGASLGAGAAPLFAWYLKPHPIRFVGGFQPSDWDPVMQLDAEGQRYVSVPDNVKEALCFRNPNPAATGGLGHATYKADSSATKLEVIEREDVHPGDFGEAQDMMVARVLGALK